MRRVSIAALVLAAVHSAPGAPLAERTLVVVNDLMPAEEGTGGTGASMFVGQYYATKRGIPAANIVHLKTSKAEGVSMDEYKAQIETPLRAFLDANGGAMRKKILYIVPVYGLPVRAGGGDNILAVDSMLSVMYAGNDSLPRVRNPYNAPLGSRPPRFEAWADQREAAGGWKMFIVSRLDGPGAAIAKALVDKAIAAEGSLTAKSGVAYFDSQGTRTPAEWQYGIDNEIKTAADMSKSRGFQTALNVQKNALCGSVIPPAAQYYYDPAAKNVAVDAAGNTAAATAAFRPVAEGDFRIQLSSESVQNTGNFIIFTLGSASDDTYIRLTYPLFPFTQWNSSDAVTLEKAVGGKTAAKATLKVDGSMKDQLVNISEFRIAVRNDVVTAYKNGALLLSATDPAATRIEVAKASLEAKCWSYRIKGFTVTDTGGAAVWSDDFTTDSTAKYTWKMGPAGGPNALWVWGWYGGAVDAYRFVPGAVGAQLTSYTALQIRTPQDASPQAYSLSTKRWAGNWVPRMLEEGVTATWGAVAEPYANLYAPGGNVFDHLWSGYNFGESFYIAQNALRWTVTPFGDPLYAPAAFAARRAASLSVVVNTASGLSGAVAPGEVVSLIGQGLGPETPAEGFFDDAGLESTTVGGTRVLFGGVPAPLLYASGAQVTAVVPYEVDGAAETEVHVEANGEASNSLQLEVAPCAPALFTADSSGQGQALAFHADQSPNSAAKPAARGSAVTLFGTGEGQTSPKGVTGLRAGNTGPVPVLPVRVFIGSAEAEVLYAGGGGGQVAGIFQLNIRVPQSAPGGAAVPVTFYAGETASQPGVTMAVEGGGSGAGGNL